MFERDSKENILNRMVAWSRSISPKLTDFRRGSVIRTIYEAVALVVEGAYNKMYTGIKAIIETNAYAVVGFDKEQAEPSSGTVYFGRTVASTDLAYLIPLGTEVVAVGNDYRPPITFRTVADAILEVGYLEVSVPVVCVEAGELTNVKIGDIDDFVIKPTGIDWVTNRHDFTDGRDEETPEQQKKRFSEFMDANTRGTLQAIEFGARTAIVEDGNGSIIERVFQASALEDTALRKGEVDLYVWNGVGTVSNAMKTEIQRILLGYYNENGDRVYGYKNGGTQVNIYTAVVSSVKIRLTLTLEDWASDVYVKDRIQKELNAYFLVLRLGQTLFFSEVVTKVQTIEGVADIRVELSTDGGTSYNTNNVVVASNKINVLTSIVYV